MKIRNWHVLCAIAVFGFIWLAICLTRIKPGEAGVLVNNLTGSQKEMNVGYHYVSPWNNVYLFPTYEQNFIWDKNHQFTFQTKEGLQVYSAMGITFSIQPDKVHILFAKYRRGLDEIADTFVYNFVRDAVNKAASHMKVEDLYGEGKENMMLRVEESVRKELHAFGFNISRIYIVGNLHMPKEVVDAIGSKIAAMQRAEQRENELKEAQAQARKEIAKAEGEAQQKLALSRAEADSKLIIAEATAKANKTVRESLSKELISYELCKRWNGQLPQVIGENSLLLNWDLK